MYGFGCTLFETEDVVDDVQVLPAAPTVRRTLRLLHPVLEAAMLVVQGSKLRRCDAGNGSEAIRLTMILISQKGYNDMKIHEHRVDQWYTVIHK